MLSLQRVRGTASFGGTGTSGGDEDTRTRSRTRTGCEDRRPENKDRGLEERGL